MNNLDEERAAAFDASSRRRLAAAVDSLIPRRIIVINVNHITLFLFWQ